VHEYANAWYCGSLSDALEFGIKASDFAINNLSFREKGALMGGLRVLEFSFSIVNRRQKSMRIDAQIAGFDSNDKLTFALKAGPMMDTVSEGKTESATGSAYVTGGELARTSKVCTRFVGDLQTPKE